ncbi:hypothetical protein KFL_005590010 [Klebsormidium nitens]|uniref:Fibrocystin-L n=1 Tax=Klebsormidium nitens TaxID=105231 RepID=A0A1Y1IK26_KLENI|nr:hypothetical protein KFL_005590010 [Klebsormidium nitens]|eukprot:GAQ89759.1 hypothetical protein KFL_005590010 [Klebsormidium nitens]
MASQLSPLYFALVLLFNLYITETDGEMVMEVPSAPVITSIVPTIGSVSGGTLLYIYGSGFSADQYMGGNAVFIEDTPCDVISYYSNTQQVVCRTRAQVPISAPSPVTIIVDGLPARSTTFCCFQYRPEATPVVSEVSPVAGPVGTRLTLSGTYFSALVDEFEKITVGDSLCSMDTANADSFGPYQVSCSLAPFSQPAASQNVTLSILRPGWINGYAKPDRQTYYVDPLERPYNFQLHPDVLSVTPSSGGLAGGVNVTITGTGFSLDPSLNKVIVGGTACVVQTSSSTEIVCLTGPSKAAPAFQSGQLFPGARGAVWEYWLGVNKTQAGMNALTQKPAYVSGIPDGDQLMTGLMEAPTTQMGNYGQRLRAFFLPPRSTYYQFYFASDVLGELWLSTADGNASAVTKIASLSYPTNRRNWGGPVMAPVFLNASARYFLEARGIAGASANSLSVGVRVSSDRPRPGSILEIQHIYTSVQQYGEIQTLSLSSLPPVAETQSIALSNKLSLLLNASALGYAPDTVGFTLTLKASQTPALALDATAAEVGTALEALPGVNSSVNVTVRHDPYGAVRTWDVTFAGMPGVAVTPLAVTIVLGASFAGRSPSDDDGNFYGIEYGDLFAGASEAAGFRSARATDELGFAGLSSLQYADLDRTGGFGFEALEQDPADLFRLAGFSEGLEGGLGVSDVRAEVRPRRLADATPFLSAAGYFTVSEKVKGKGTLGGFFTLSMNGSDVTSKFLSVNASVSDIQAAIIASAQPVLGKASASITVTRSLTTALSTQWNVSFPFQTSPVPLLTVDSTYLSGNGASGGAFRSRPGSGPLGGAFGVGFGNGTVTTFRALPVISDGVQAREILESLPAIKPGDVDVSVDWSPNAYYGYGWRITFQGNLAGQQPLLVVNSSRLTGPGASARVVEEQQGSFDQWMRPIPGDYLREPVPVPQSVSVSVDGIIGSCSDPAYCAFTYSVALTPNISSVSPTNGTIGDTITISGQGFSPLPSNNTVLVGGVRAQVTSSSGAQIQAKLAPGGAAGWTRVVVIVDGKGYAADSAAGVSTFRLRILQLASFWPPTVSTQGGTLVTLTGSGFDPLNVTRNAVTICGATCPLVNVTTSSQTLTCVAPRAAAGQCSVLVSVDLGSGQTDSVSLSGMTYVSTGVPSVESVNPARIAATGGGLILIQGQDLAGSVVTLRDLAFGRVADCGIVSANGTQVTCKAQGAAAGAYRVLVTSAGNVTAISGSTVEVALEITSVIPSAGTLAGGSVLTITGFGFPVTNVSTSVTVVTIQVPFSTTFPNGVILCDVATSDLTQVTCVTRAHCAADANADDPTGTDCNFRESLRGSVTVSVCPEGADADTCWADVRTPQSICKQGGNCTFSYSAAESPVITRVFPRTGTISGSITVTGTGITNDTTVAVGGLVCNTTTVSYVDSNGYPSASPDPQGLVFITCRVPGLPVGKYPVSAKVPGIGFAVGMFTYTYAANVSAAGPLSGSLEGGQVLTLQGIGFNDTNPEENRVFLGPLSCAVTTVTASEIQCVAPQMLGLVAQYFYYGVPMGQGVPSLVSRTPDVVRTESVISYAGGYAAWPGLDLRFAMRFAARFAGFIAVPTTGNYTFFLTSDDGSLLYLNEVLVVNNDFNHGMLEVPGSAYLYAGDYVPFRVDYFQGDGGLGLELRWQGPGISKQIVPASAYVIVPPETPVGIEVQVNGLPATVNGYSFTYSAAATPLVTSVSPVNLNGSANITLTGQNLQNANAFANVTVLIGGPKSLAQATCQILAWNTSAITCTAPVLPAGSYPIQVNVDGMGYASGLRGLTLSYALAVTSVSPANGSVYGGTVLTVQGLGFSANSGDYLVSIGGLSCKVLSSSAQQLRCVTQPGSAQQLNCKLQIGLTSTVLPKAFSYLTSLTPAVSSVNPAQIPPATSTLVTLTGTLFTQTNAVSDLSNFSDVTSVLIGQAPCPLTFANGTAATCNAPALPAGTYPVFVNSVGLGLSSGTPTLSVPLTVTSVQPTKGGLAGGLVMTISGTGFSSNITDYSIVIGGARCLVLTSSVTGVSCLTGAAAAGMRPIQVSMGAYYFNNTAFGAFEYRLDLTPQLAAVSPTRGSTAGGTLVTLSGSGFGAAPSNVTVTIADVTCAVQASGFSDAQFTCLTGAHNLSSAGPLTVFVNGKGFAAVGGANSSQTTVTYQYVDLWSRNSTWGGTAPPVAGDSVLLPAGQTVLLDVSPPLLNLLIVEGSLLFDDSSPDEVHLSASYIMVRGGKVQIGTEAKPFAGRARITLRCHRNCPEIPVYGAKVLGNRHGTLEIHGQPKSPPWTRLAVTALRGTNQLVLQEPTNWRVNDTIMVTSSSFDARDAETAVVTAVANNGSVLTLDRRLANQHNGEYRVFDGHVVDMRAEVAVLSRNVVFEGANNPEDGPWEMNMYGAHIMVHSPGDDSAVARLANVEVRNAGQAFRLGRYPIHFHMIGRVTQSYVRNCSVHDTFNRAIAIHGVNNLEVSNNVAFNNMGHAFFIEDGIEQNNAIFGNLGALTRKSFSLLQTDTTPATFWVTNPNNFLVGNTAAGSEGYGYWYNPEDHPTGPSYTTNVCPKRTPLGAFRDNTAHSNNKYGLRIFPEYYPLTQPCNYYSPPATAVFQNFTSYSNGMKGSIATQVGVLYFEDFKLVDNGGGPEASIVAGKDHAGGIEIAQVWSVPSNPARINRALIVAKSDPNAAWPSGRDLRGVLTQTVSSALRVNNVTFVNFKYNNTYALEPCAKCKFQQGGWSTYFSSLRFVNSPNLVRWLYVHEGVFVDTDGSLTGAADASMVADDGLLDPSECGRLPGVVGGQVADPSDWRTAGGSSEARRMGQEAERPASFAVKGRDAFLFPDVLEHCQYFRTTKCGSVPCAFAQTVTDLIPFKLPPGGRTELLPGVSGNAVTRAQTPGVFRGSLSSLSLRYNQTQSCAVIQATAHTHSSVSAQVCAPGLVFRRIALNRHTPDQGTNSIFYAPLLVSGINATSGTNGTSGTSRVPFSKENNIGYQFAAISGRDYRVSWDLPYRVDPSGFQLHPETARAADWVFLHSKQMVTPDHFYVQALPGSANVPALDRPPLPLSADPHGSHYFNKTVHYITNDTTHTILLVGNTSTDLQMNRYMCPDAGCPLPRRLADYRNGTLFWSDPLTWGNGTAPGTPPADGDDVTVPLGWFLVLDVDSPRLKSLTIEGTMVFAPLDLKLTSGSIFINGGELLIGNSTNPYTNSAVITLTGDRFSPELAFTDALNFGAKSIAVLGTFSVHGAPRARTWTKLARSIQPGDTQIVLANPVDWLVGDQIVLTPTRWDPAEAEVLTVNGVVNGGLTVLLQTRARYPHFGDLVPLVNGTRQLDVRGEVGLLTHNVVIQGEVPPPELDAPENNRFGCRVVVSAYAGYNGTLQLENVEFRHCGQAGLDRNVIDFLYAGDVTGSYVRTSSMRDSFNNALNIRGTNGFEFRSNVVYYNFDSSSVVLLSGSNNTIARNLALGNTKVMKSPHDMHLPATYEIWAPRNSVTGNVAAGSERLGFRVIADSCNGTADFAGNTAHTSLIGLYLHQGSDGKVARTCTAVRKFQAWRNWDFGILAPNVASDVEIADVTLSDNRHGVTVNKQSSMQQEGHVYISDSLVVGESARTKCADPPHSNPSGSSYAASDPNIGIVGVTFALSFSIGPPKPWDIQLMYTTVRGRALLSNVTFANFPGVDACGRTSTAISNNRQIQDAFPLHDLQRIAFDNVPRGAQLYFYRPDPGWRNPSDCVDMDCDGALHIMIKDLDGSFMGVPGGSIVGHYDAPRAPIQQGTAVYSPQCVLNTVWAGYECQPFNQRMFVIESRDSDTETRRIAPVLLGNSGVVDVMTGCADHGWCFGYTCQKRLSTFWTSVGSGRTYELNFTGTPPRNLRLHFPYVPATEELLVKINYFEPNRLYVYLEGTGRINPVTSPPQLGVNAAHGSYYWDQPSSIMWVLLRGGGVSPEIRTEPVIMVSSTLAMNIADFFENNFVSNLAFVLGIDTTRIKVVSIKAGSVLVDWEIHDDPANFNQALPEPSFDPLNYANPNDTFYFTNGTTPGAPSPNPQTPGAPAAAAGAGMAAILSAFQAASTNGTLQAVLKVPIKSKATYSAADGVSADVKTPVLTPDAPPPGAPGPGAPGPQPPPPPPPQPTSAPSPFTSVASVVANSKLAAIIGGVVGAAAAFLLILGVYGFYRMYTARRVAVAPLEPPNPPPADGASAQEKPAEAQPAVKGSSDPVPAPKPAVPPESPRGKLTPREEPKPSSPRPASETPVIGAATSSHVSADVTRPAAAVVAAAAARPKKSSDTKAADVTAASGRTSPYLAPLVRRGGKPAPDPTELLVTVQQQKLDSPRGGEQTPKSPPTLEPESISSAPLVREVPTGTPAKPGLAPKPTFKQSDKFSEKLSEMDRTISRKKEAEAESGAAQRKGGSAKGVQEDQMSQLVRGKFPEANPSFVPSPDVPFDDDALEETEKNKRKQKKVLTRTGSALSELVEAKFAEEPSEAIITVNM